MTQKQKKQGGRGGFSLPKFRMEAERTPSGISMLFCGVISVSQFSESETCLVTKGGTITVLGSGLQILIYESNVIEIEGKIENIKISQGSVRRKYEVYKN